MDLWNNCKLQDIELAVAQAARRTGRNYTLGKAYGKYQLQIGRGARTVSPFLSKKDMGRWMSAFLAGMRETEGVIANCGVL